MWKQREATNLLNYLTLALVFTLQLLGSARADKRLCGDPNCKEIISLGTGKINFQRGDYGMVSFKMNSVIRIKSKPAGGESGLWGIEVNGREGFAPKRFIREDKIIVREKDLIIVDVEQKKENHVLSTSEKTINLGNNIDATTTTKPLDPLPAIATENLLNNSSNEKINTDSLPVATPVTSNIVDGTKIPLYGNDQDKDSAEENKQKSMDKSGKVTVVETNVGYGKKSEDENLIIGVKEEHFNANANVDVKNLSDDGKTEKLLKNEHDTRDQEERKTNVEPLAENSSEEKPKVIENDKISQTEEIGVKQLNNVTYDQTERDLADFDGNSTEENGQVNNLYIGDKVKDNPLNEDKTIINELEQNLENERLATNQYNIQNVTESQNLTENYIPVNTNNTSRNQEPTNNIDVDSHSNEKYVETNLTNNTTETENFNSIENVPFHSTNEEKLNENIINTNAQEPGEKPITKESITKESNTSLAKEHIIEMVSEEPQKNVDTVVGSFELEGDVGHEKTSIEINDRMLADEPQKGEKDIPSSSKGGVDIEKNMSEIMEKETKTDKNSEALEKSKINVSVENSLEPETKSKINEDDSQQAKTGDVNNMDSINSFSSENVVPQSIDAGRTIGSYSEGFPESTSDSEVNVRETVSDTIYQTTTATPGQAEVTEQKISPTPHKSIDDNPSNEPIHNQNDFYQQHISTSLPPYENHGQNFAHTEKNLDSTNHHHYVPSATIQAETHQKNDETSNITPPMHNLEPNNHHDVPSAIMQPVTHEKNDETSKITPPMDTPNNHHDMPNAIVQPETLQKNDKTSKILEPINHHDVPSVNIQEKTDKNNDEESKITPATDNFEPKENKGLFATIMGTVNNVLNSNKKKHSDLDTHGELDRILFSQGNKNNFEKVNEVESFPYCKNIGPNGDCPEPNESHESHTASHFQHASSKSLFDADITIDSFLKVLTSKILEISELLAFLVIAAAASLFFVFGYYCFCNSSREGALLLKLNQLESSLLASHKENAILKHNLMCTRQKLASIEDNSFGSNDMVVSLKKELEEELLEKARLQEQITVLQKELENAADAGIELNKIVSELLSNQTGDESIISSVEELQKQLNEQQNTIYEINASLAEKSRDNSELQLLIAEQNARYEAELANVQRDNDELEHEKGNLLTRIQEMKTDFDNDITAALEGKNMEIKRLQNEIIELSNKFENEHTKWQTSVAKIEALEECLKSVRRDPKVNISEVIDVANVKAQLIEIQKIHKSLKERLEAELDARKLAENQLAIVTAEVEKLKQDFNQSEKDKLEAQTRLEVLSNYFKDKENQLQKELSLKEAMWLKQQGETTTTVDRVTAMQEEIQSLKSQNDSLRAEIEAQVAAHKAQIGTLENRAHETWLAARQSDRRYEEARAEATALRRKLTSLAGGNVNEVVKTSTGPAALGDELAQAPSPIHMESPGSPMLGRMPPPPFLPPPFMGPPPPFMGMPPPPPFVPPGEMRPAPLGRIMSPPPQRSGRFSPQHLDYEDYLDYESNNNWHRHTYSPPPRTYRSLSPTDSRYNYGTERDLISTYDTETDFSPPPSPRESRRRMGTSSERIDSNTKTSYGNTKKFNSSNKGPLSSGSEKSFHNLSHNDTKTKKGSSSVGGKNLV